MWTKNWRHEIWEQLDQPWDIVVVGGGITGAGILREATRLGLRALLVEQRDFGWGTSSRSSKLVHGGLRYLKEGRVGLTLESVQEREQLLEDGPGLIDPLGFLLATYESDKIGRFAYRAGLTVYDLLALQWSHRYYSATDFRMLAPHLTAEGLKGGFHYGDAQTDDARLVLRVIREAVADGGVALNYVSAQTVLPDENGRITGVTLCDNETGRQVDVHARLVINATGVWADRLRAQVGADEALRPLRGSHLVFPRWRIPVAQAVSFLHPLDQRPVMIFPWDGVTLVGTTDVDHRQNLDEEPAITAAEVAYLMTAVEAQFPSLSLTLEDIMATFAGVRPVIGTGKADPSEESRDHVVWEESGLLTVTGGKLTTFRRIAIDAIKKARHRLPKLPTIDDETPVLNPVDLTLAQADHLDEATRRRLLGRYGADAPALVEAAQANELQFIPGTKVLWAELRWAARAEGVVHLDDLLLRRVRLGLLLREGGREHMSRIRAICQPELGWDDERWQTEEADYLRLCRQSYGLPDPALIPDWRQMLRQARADTAVSTPSTKNQTQIMALIMAGLALLFTLLFLKSRRAKPAT